MADVAAEVGALGVASKAASPKLSHHEAFAQEARWIAHSMGLSIDQQQLDRQPRSAAPAAAAAGTDDDLGASTVIEVPTTADDAAALSWLLVSDMQWATVWCKVASTFQAYAFDGCAALMFTLAVLNIPGAVAYIALGGMMVNMVGLALNVVFLPQTYVAYARISVTQHRKLVFDRGQSAGDTAECARVVRASARRMWQTALLGMRPGRAEREAQTLQHALVFPYQPRAWEKLVGKLASGYQRHYRLLLLLYLGAVVTLVVVALATAQLADREDAAVVLWILFAVAAEPLLAQLGVLAYTAVLRGRAVSHAARPQQGAVRWERGRLAAPVLRALSAHECLLPDFWSWQYCFILMDKVKLGPAASAVASAAGGSCSPLQQQNGGAAGADSGSGDNSSKALQEVKEGAGAAAAAGTGGRGGDSGMPDDAAWAAWVALMGESVLYNGLVGCFMIDCYRALEWLRMLLFTSVAVMVVMIPGIEKSTGGRAGIAVLAALVGYIRSARDKWKLLERGLQYWGYSSGLLRHLQYRFGVTPIGALAGAGALLSEWDVWEAAAVAARPGDGVRSYVVIEESQDMLRVGDDILLGEQLKTSYI